MPGFDQLAGDWQQDSRVPSLSIAVLRRGAVVHAAGFGDGKVETVYQAASLGKHFTAALTLLLARSGEGPALDGLVARDLPELPEEWNGITLRHLLSHTSGIPAAGYESLDLGRDYSDSELLEAITGDHRLDFAPGRGFRYSNAGYVLAGLLLGRIAGAFYADLIGERIFAPLGMTSAAVTAPRAPTGYVRDGGLLAPAEYVSPTLNRLADGGLSLSVMDFARWDAALWSDWGGQVAEMFIETRLTGGEPSGYGLGWFLSSGRHGRVALHEGGWQGFSSAMVRYLDAGVSAVVLANVAQAEALQLADRLARAELEAGRS